MKYGRLFTEADVRAMLLEAACTALDSTADPSAGEIVDEVLREYPARFPADEPLFLLRGQDAAAPDAIRTRREVDDEMDYYASACRMLAPDEHLTAIDAAAREMREWQAAHPDRVKVPD